MKNQDFEKLLERVEEYVSDWTHRQLAMEYTERVAPGDVAVIMKNFPKGYLIRMLLRAEFSPAKRPKAKR